MKSISLIVGCLLAVGLADREVMQKTQEAVVQDAAQMNHTSQAAKLNETAAIQQTPTTKEAHQDLASANLLNSNQESQLDPCSPNIVSKIHDAAHCVLFFLPQGIFHPRDPWHFMRCCPWSKSNTAGLAAQLPAATPTPAPQPTYVGGGSVRVINGNGPGYYNGGGYYNGPNGGGYYNGPNGRGYYNGPNGGGYYNGRGNGYYNGRGNGYPNGNNNNNNNNNNGYFNGYNPGGYNGGGYVYNNNYNRFKK
ncbi:hypothetical protein GQ602_001082 [Ophiocordyceps camponoti-floridani]|uniref:Uncharacterized protein n=1 Tax=Ophiocordyceps camponoti-floridani TaxID=2030778 RepID=A0A8H4VGV6_9HYPO|nr:hypothetical protein GQ602_001082 [Ophiocordyceps camponoti-floridani]